MGASQLRDLDSPTCDLKKVVLVGDCGSGKTSLAIFFSKGCFSEAYTPADNLTANVDVEGKDVELALWVLSGQCDYERLRPLLYQDAHVVLICFSIDYPYSLDYIPDKWHLEVDHLCPNIPILLVGCKKDLRYDPKIIEDLRKVSQHPVTPEEAMLVAQKIGAKQYLECSARIGDGVCEVLRCAARYALLPRKAKRKKIDCVVL